MSEIIKVFGFLLENQFCLTKMKTFHASRILLFIQVSANRVLFSLLRGSSRHMNYLFCSICMKSSLSVDSVISNKNKNVIGYLKCNSWSVT